MIKLEIEGVGDATEYFIATDDAQAELLRMTELFDEAAATHLEFYQTLESTRLVGLHVLVQIPEDEVDEVIEILSVEYPQIENEWEKHRIAVEQKGPR